MTKTTLIDTLSILYLEDEPLISLDTSEFLNELGFEVVVTTFKLKTALEAASERKFDVALLDINVDKGQTSFELGKELVSAGSVVMFASGNSIDAPRLRAQGYRFIDKPFNRMSLKTEILALLEGLG